eukprot:TRINITY_DN8784_c0_g1_i9.p1 TRINITY_DN8784_c0_g1~~TRINITY_DN8784_c0_g1_i9.p1  ORF type:complete len:364 (+),score=88.92 TRINITY_DN8784_c0_g1_i9:183-1274(+)
MLNYIKENLRDTSTYSPKGIVVHYLLQNSEDQSYSIYELPPDLTFDKPITIKTVLDRFPLRDSGLHYHFRFMALTSQQDPNQKAWVDITNSSAKAPVINKAIYMKVLQVPNRTSSKIYGHRRSSFHSRSTDKKPEKKEEPTQPKQEAPQPRQEPIRPPPVANPPAPVRPVEQPKPKQEFVQSPLSKEAQPTKTASFPDFGLYENHPANQSPTRKDHPDFIEFEEETKYNNQGGRQKEPAVQRDVNLFDFDDPVRRAKFDPLYVSAEDRAKLEKKMEEKLDELRQQNLKVEREGEEKHNAQLELEPKILKWAKKDTVRNNIRTLLCNLHEVLWEGTKWTQVSIASIVSNEDVHVSFFVFCSQLL